MSNQDKAAKSDSFVDAVAALAVISLVVLTAVVFLSSQ